jgi:cyclomaltodextrinase / maltogenic alpha-amylase / neopullulanase
VPSIYYGSEFGLTGKRTQNDDSALRPYLDLAALQQNCPQPHLPAALARLAALRQSLPALKLGDYQQVGVSHEQLIFARSIAGQTVYVAINAAEQPVEVQFDLFQPADSLQDKLNGGEPISVQNKHCRLTLPPYWARVLA